MKKTGWRGANLSVDIFFFLVLKGGFDLLRNFEDGLDLCCRAAIKDCCELLWKMTCRFRHIQPQDLIG